MQDRLQRVTTLSAFSHDFRGDVTHNRSELTRIGRQETHKTVSPWRDTEIAWRGLGTVSKGI